MKRTTSRTRRRTALLVVAVVVAGIAGRAWGLDFGLGETKEELKLKYDIAIEEHSFDGTSTGRVTLVLTLADEGRLKPLDGVQLDILGQEKNKDGSNWLDLVVLLDMRKMDDGRRIGRVHIKKDLAERAVIRLNTRTMDGKTGLTGMYHVIPISKYFKSSPATTPSALSEAKTREKLETLIPEAIRILEAKEYATFLNDFLSPADFKAISQNTGLDEKEFAKQFGDKRAPQLLAILRAISDAKPTLDSTGTIATYELKEEIYAKRKFSFQKIDKYWYMLNKPK